MKLYKEFLIVESSADFDSEFDIKQVLDFVKATNIENATKIANRRGYDIPKNAKILINNLSNINTTKLSIISNIINGMIDNGLDDKHISEYKNKLKQIKRLLTQIL